MPVDRPEQFRRKAEECLEEAELSQDETLKSRMLGLADEWLKLAARTAMEKDHNHTEPVPKARQSSRSS
jgi:hypothetical protein